MLPLHEPLSRIERGVRLLLWRIFFSKEFHSFGNKVKLHRPKRLRGLSKVSLHDGVCVRDNAWIEVDARFEDAEIVIGANTYIGDDIHIYAVNKIEIGKSVLIANRVYISDNIHCYEDCSMPILDQEVLFKNSVKIGDGAWLGENVCVIGASIGKNSIVGANSVVVSDVPSYCVVAGVPAKMIKYYDEQVGGWIKCN